MRFPDKYPAKNALQDKEGYAATAAQFRAHGNDYGGEWMTKEGGCLPLRARLGAAGIYVDQTGAIAPEICAATGHGHDGESFGFWNRGYLELLREMKEAGASVSPGFFMETEGSSDLYGKYIVRSMGNFRLEEQDCAFSRLFRYTVPWFKGNLGTVDPAQNASLDKIRDLLERTLMLGETFRFAINTKFDPANPQTIEAARLVKAAVSARRALSPYYDDGTFMGDQGLRVDGGEGAWFAAGDGILIAVQASRAAPAFSLAGARNANTAKARMLDWETGKSVPFACRKENGRIVADSLCPGLTLVVVPAR